MSRTPKATRRRPLRVLLISLLLGLVLIWALAWAVLSSIPTFSADLATAPLVGRATYLLVGSDSRENLGDLEGEFGLFAGERADVIMVARPVDGQLRILSLPRDLKVDIAGHGVNKLNAAYAFGGSELLADTIESSFGVPIHHVVEIDFGGFASLVDAAGGIAVDFPYAARDAKSGLDVPAGTTSLDGAMAVAYVRSRSYQELRDGAWVSIDADDIGRTVRQQTALRALISTMVSPAGLMRLPSVLSALDDGLRRSESLGLTDAFVTAVFMYTRQVDAMTLPVVFSNEGGVSYVIADGTTAKSAWQWLLGE